jgi:hypothetical protein
LLVYGRTDNFQNMNEAMKINLDALAGADGTPKDLTRA